MGIELKTIRAESPYREIRQSLRSALTDDQGFRAQVAEIIRAVVERGEPALLELTARHDEFTCGSVADLRVSRAEMEMAAATIPVPLRQALELAAANIKIFHEKQIEHGYLDFLPDGSLLGQRVSPLGRVGVYVPGGRASYPSSVLMNVVPARVAGVERIVMVSPAMGGRIEPSVLAAAHIAGVDEMYRIGGAQAVAALAYGTETIQPVDKIVGPGNRWVTEAKRQVFGRVDIDLIAGPSEILVIADHSANPQHVAADLIGQAEHDPEAIAWLVTDNAKLAAAVPGAVEDLLKTNTRASIARESLERNGLIVVVPDLASAVTVFPSTLFT